MVTGGAGRRRGPTRLIATLAAVLGLGVAACGDQSAAQSVDGPAKTDAPSEVAAEPTDPPDHASGVATDGDEPATNPLPTRLAGATDAFELRECPKHLDGAVAGRSETCGFVTVPLDHDEPDGETIRLAVTFVDNGAGDVPPTFFLPGGPGAPAARNAPALRGAPFDVIGVDERGVGHSEPSLDCPELDELFPANLAATAAEGWDDYLAGVAACRQRLEDEGVDVTRFDSRQSARDLGVVQRALGFDEVMLLGASYGSRTVLTKLREEPEGVASVWLDSVVPLEADLLATHSANYDRALDHVADDCATSELCAELGNVHERMALLETTLTVDPIIVTGQRPFGAGELDVVIDDEGLRWLVHAAMYDGRVMKGLPYALAAAGDGDIEALGPLVDHALWTVDSTLPFSEGFHLSVLCREEYPFNDAAAVAANQLSGYDWAAVCEVWDTEPADPIEDQPVTSDVPAMIFAGSFDPITPPEWSRSVADALPNATYVEIADQGHVVGPVTKCTQSLIEAFVTDPTAELDTACADESGSPNWRVN